MAITSFMNLDLPAVQQTVGPEWAVKVNEAFDSVDEHDHSSGKGIKIKPGGLDINSELNFQNNRAANVGSLKLTNLGAALSGATNTNVVQSVNGDLYFTNNAGVAIQITSGGSIVSTPGSTTSLEVTSINSNLTIAPASTFVVILVDTTASRTIDLPLASSVATGRIYMIKDKDGLSKTNPITLACQGSDLVDGSASIELDSNRVSNFVVSDGTLNWYIL